MTELSLNDKYQNLISTIQFFEQNPQTDEQLFKLAEEFLSIQPFIEQMFVEVEEVEDMSTNSIPFTQYFFWLGDILLKIKGNSANLRKHYIMQAQGFLDKFLTLSQNLKVMTKEQLEQWKSETYGNEESRESKIKRLEFQQQLESMVNKLKKCEDEESLRMIYIFQTQICIKKALEFYKLTTIEMQIIQNEAFEQIHQTQKPSWPQAKISVEEFGDMEVERMKREEAEKKQRELEKSDSDSEKEEVAEKKRKKASEWDNWKDEHEKGAGNKLR